MRLIYLATLNQGLQGVGLGKLEVLGKKAAVQPC